MNGVRAARVIHTGQAIVDLVLTVDALPDIGGDVFASSHELTAGGGFNVMAAAARDGASVVYAGGRGSGPFAAIVDAALRREGIAATAVAHPRSDIGFSVALVDADAERTFVSTTGAEADIAPDHFDSVKLRAGDVVYVSGYSLYHRTVGPTVLAWLSRVRPSTVVVDASPMIDAVPHDLLAAARSVATLWTLNQREAQLFLAKIAPDTRAGSIDQVAGVLADTLRRDVIVRVGADGCVLASPGGAPELIAGFPTAAIDTNGAGDAHTGVLCAGLAAGHPLAECARRANAAAAIAVTRRGPATSPDGAEIDAALEARAG